MLEKYDLEKMLKEIKEDEKLEEGAKGEASQDMIKKMMMKRLKKKKVKNE